MRLEFINLQKIVDFYVVLKSSGRYCISKILPYISGFLTLFVEECVIMWYNHASVSIRKEL